MIKYTLSLNTTQNDPDISSFPLFALKQELSDERGSCSTWTRFMFDVYVFDLSDRIWLVSIVLTIYPHTRTSTGSSQSLFQGYPWRDTSIPFFLKPCLKVTDGGLVHVFVDHYRYHDRETVRVRINFWKLSRPWEHLLHIDLPDQVRHILFVNKKMQGEQDT
jgi:hypothetical protein